MPHPTDHSRSRQLRRLGLAGSLTAGIAAAGLFGATSVVESLQPAPTRAQGTPSLLEFRWESNRDYRKLYFFQSSTRKREKSEYYFILRPKDRKNAILKLSISVPKHFNADIKASNLKLCRMDLGGMLSRSRCKEVLPAVFEVNEEQSEIAAFPETPIPADKYTYAVVMKVFNPSNFGMFQFNALAQAPGDVPISGYLGSWLVDIE